MKARLSFKYLMLWLCFCYPVVFWAQNNFGLHLIAADQRLPGDFSGYYMFKTRSERYLAIEDLRQQMFKRGHLAFSIDSLVESGNNQYAFVHIGDQFKWARLSAGNLDGDVAGSIKFKDKLFYKKQLQPNQVTVLFESILKYCENKGYPFARVKLDSLVLDSTVLSASIFLDKNRLVKIDSVLVKGTTKTHPHYFQHYLGLKPGDLYNESLIRGSETWLQELQFVTMARPTEVIFTEKFTKIQLYLNHKKASRFDGIIGFQPNDQTGKISFTGDVKLNILNGFRRGETILLNWRRLQTATQDLLVSFKYPYLFNTPFGADVSFSLYRRDSSFVQVKGNLGVAYLMSGGDYIKVMVQPQQSNVLSKLLTPANGLASVDITLFGLEISKSRYNYRFNPIKGYGVLVNGAVGNKKIRQNPEFPESFYEGISLNSTQWTANLNANFFVPLSKRNTVMVAAKGALLQNDNMFVNELYRIGGMSTIRGFDEESIFASAYSIFTLEYRFLLEKNSNIFLFAEGAWYEANTSLSFVTDTPLGFGAGISFETKAGIFSLTYALGRQFNNPLLLRNGKIHFGFINFF
jgi:outer membrane protein assembly factor BamA